MQFRERLLNILLGSTVIFGAALYVIYLVPSLKYGFSTIAIVYTILFIWLLVILFVHRIPYLVRTGSWLIILYAMGVIYIILHGLGIHAGLLFLAFVIMATLLVGMQYGLTAFLASIITIATIGTLSSIGAIHPQVDLSSGTPIYWLGGGVVFLLVGIILVISTTSLINTLDDGLNKATSLAGKLEEANLSLQANEERFRAIIEDSADIIAIVGLTNTIQYVNPGSEEILGYTVDELKGHKIFEFIHPEDIKIASDYLTPGASSVGNESSVELRVRHKNRSWRTLEVRGNKMHTNPAVKGTIIIGRDITKRKETQKELMDSHHLLKMVFASLSGALFILDPQMTIIRDSNPAASTIFGYSREELVGQSIALLYTDPVSFEEFRRSSYSSLKGNGVLTNFEFQMKRKDGSIFPTEHNLVPLDDPNAGRVGWVTVIRNVTERKRLEKQLREINEGLEYQVGVKTRELQEREQIQRAILEASDQSILMLDLNGIILLANETAAKRMNRELKDFVGFCVWDMLSPEVSRTRKEVANSVFNTGKSAILIDERDGMYLEATFYPIYSKDDKVDRVVLFARDITEQRRIEAALQASEEKYRLLAEASHDMIYVITEDHLIEYVNSYAAAQFNLGSDALVGKRQTSTFPTDFATHQREGIASVLSTGSPNYSENWINFGEGKNAYVSTWLIPLNDQVNGKRSVMGISRDITSIKRMQEELKLSHDQLEKRVEERTKELSDLSAGMRLLAQKVITAQEEERRRISRELHDDTGQVLVTLKYSLAELLKEQPGEVDIVQQRLSEGIKEVDEAITNIRSIAHSLRPPLLDAGGLNISLMDFCDDINQRTKIKVTYDGEELEHLPEEIAVTLYRVVQEAISNILKHSQATDVTINLKYIQNWIILSISDNGVGIQSTQNKTGIGLIGIRERVGYLGGELQINTSPGKGTFIRAAIPWNGPVIEL